MATEQLQQSTEKARELFVAPFQELTSLYIDYLGKATEIHLDALKKLTDQGIRNAHEALEIRNAEGLQEYIRHQSQAASTITSQVQEDGRKLMELGQDYAHKAGEIAQHRFTQASKAA